MNEKIQQRILRLLAENTKQPLGFMDIKKKLNIRRNEFGQFSECLQELEENGTVYPQRGRYTLTKALGLIPAQIVKLNGTFGFARPVADEEQPDAEPAPDVFIPGRALKGAMPGDFVVLRPIPSRGTSPEGEVARITGYGKCLFTGVYHTDGRISEVLPDRLVKFAIPVPKADSAAAKDGDKVLAEISARGERHSDHRARVLQVFGSAERAQACCESVVAVHGIRTDFPKPVLDEAEQVSRAGIAPEELQNRLDLRGEIIFTIDGADTKDIDDAVSIEKTADGWKLGVHIADVSHYVRPRSKLDEEAFARGTSVYYANNVIPMLPKALSNGICSLNPDEERLAFSALMTLGSDGALQSFQFAKTVIRSRLKGVYSEINSILAGEADEPLREKYREVYDRVFLMKELGDILAKRRFARGGLDIESSEAKMIIGEDGRIVDIVPRERGDSEKFIEDFMLCANEAAATFAKRAKAPFVYRIHENPNPEKLHILADLLRMLGLDARKLEGDVRQRDLADILNQVRGKPTEKLINTSVLRSMAKARYADEPIGHYGLVLADYTHFTSPIRRYPDLVIHRILGDLLRGVPVEKLEKRYAAFVKEASEQASQTELTAMLVERDCEDCYKAEYMLEHLGVPFDGVISSVAPHGVYVELQNTVEGLVRGECLPGGEYEYDGVSAYRDRVTGHCYRIGDEIRVVAVRADVTHGQIDFIAANSAEEAAAVAAAASEKRARARSFR